MPMPPYFKGDPTHLIEEEWWLPLLSRKVSDLLKIEMLSARMTPMEQTLCPLSLGVPNSKEEDSISRALEMDAHKDAPTATTEDPPSSPPA